MDTIRFGCAFCDKDVEGDDVASFTLSFRGYNQTWFGHSRCFIDAMVEPYRSELRPEFRDL